MVICITIDYSLFSNLLKFCSKRIVMLHKTDVDPDVQAEADKINSHLSKGHAYDQIVLGNLSKKYDNNLAVNQLSVGIKRGECFGLLGTNGAGKTSIFKMLTGDEEITVGNAFIESVSIKNEINEAHNNLGYCPQVDALLDDLTGRESLKIFSMLRGVPKDNIYFVVKSLAEDLGFFKHLDKQIKNLDGRNKRKLSTALALLGGPSVVLLDKPTTGIDPVAKHQLWNVINQARDAGHTVILTTNSMEECEELCTKLAVMVNGQFKCLGMTEDLKNKFTSGFLLTLKISNLQQIPIVKENIAEQFPKSVLRDDFFNILTYHITHLKLSEVFGTIEKLKNQLTIADYSVTHTTLDEVFLFMSKKAQNNQ